MAARATQVFDIGGGTVYGFAVSRRDGALYAACGNGLYRSGDGGQSWLALKLPGGDALACTAAVVADDGSIFAAVQGAILRSSDGGDTFFTAAFAAPPPLFAFLALSPHYERDAMMLAGAMEDGIFASDDRGVTWQPWNFGLFDLSALCLTFSPDFATDETVYVGTETGLYRSENGARAWRFTSFPTDMAPLQSLAILSREKRIFAGTEAHGLLWSDDGETWQHTDGVAGAVNQLQTVGADGLLALTDHGIMLSRDGGATWDFVWRGDGMISAMLLLDDGETLLLGEMGAGIRRARMP